MNSIGSLLKETRESSGVTIKEVSEDLSIKEEFLLNIENGNIGCFKDIYELKTYIASYAKYLGLDSDKLIDEPLVSKEENLEKVKEEEKKVVSPYTRKPHKYSKKYYIGIYVVIIILVILAIFWSIKQITIDNVKTRVISYVEFRK